MEEIDIIELLKRVKEGKAPKEIEIEGEKYNYASDYDIEIMYENGLGEAWLRVHSIFFGTKIKILDKPIIERLSEETTIGIEGSTIKAPTNMALMFKINEIIDHINNKENKDE